MFGFIADGLTVAITVLFPVFASYKALHTSDPAQLAPWLTYFLVLALLTTIENTFDFILSWIPFYAWIRFFAHLYLILPGSQGATFLYFEYIEPLLYHHEREIDDFITDAHARAKAAGIGYLEAAIEWAKVNVLGMRPSERPRTPPQGQTYAQTFMSRFAMPNARADNLTTLVAQALSGASALYAGNTSAQAQEISRSATLVPDSIRNPDDRMSYVASQRERLQSLLQAFDRESDDLRTSRDDDSLRNRYYDERSGSGLSRNRSEAEFDRIERDEVGGGGGSGPLPYPTTPPVLGRRTSSGWMPWNWRQGQPLPPSRSREDVLDVDDLAYGREPGDARARTSGYEYSDRDR